MRWFIITLMLIVTQAIPAQEDVWVEGYYLRGGHRIGGIHANHRTDRFVPGYWEEGSNGVAYDNFSWRLGDDHFTTPPHVRDESLGEDWFAENWADRYDERQFQNPYYETEAIDFTRDVASTSLRYEQGDRHRLEGSFHDAVTFTIEEGEWCTVELESSDFDPHLTVLNTDGRLDRSEDFGDWNPRVDIEARRAGTVLVLITSQDIDARGRFQVHVRRRPGPINPDHIENDLRRALRRERRAQERAEEIATPTLTSPEPTTLAPAITQEADHRWVDEDGGIYSITPSGNPLLR